MGFCEEYRRELTERMVGPDIGERVDAAAKHMLECRECAEYLAETEKLLGYIRNEPLPAPTEEYVSGLSGKVLAGLGGKMPPAGASGRIVKMPVRGRFLRYAAAVAAMVILVFGYARIQEEFEHPVEEKTVSVAVDKSVVPDIYAGRYELDIPSEMLDMDVDIENLEMGLIPKGGTAGIEDIERVQEQIAVSMATDELGEYIDSMTEEEAGELLKMLEKENIRG